jgi:hypothetical protein
MQGTHRSQDTETHTQSLHERVPRDYRCRPGTKMAYISVRLEYTYIHTYIHTHMQGTRHSQDTVTHSLRMSEGQETTGVELVLRGRTYPCD